MILRHIYIYISYIVHNISNISCIIIEPLNVSNDLRMIKVVDWQIEITLFDNL